MGESEKGAGGWYPGGVETDATTVVDGGLDSNIFQVLINVIVGIPSCL